MGQARFTKTDLARALDAAKEAGYVVSGYVIDPDGTIRVNTAPALPDERTAQPIDLVKWSKTK